MIRVTALYPKTDGATFDHDYFRDTHVPMAMKAWGLKSAAIDKGLDGPFEAAVHFEFESMDAVGAAMGSDKTGAVMADMPNYTTITPQLQTSEIVS